MDRNDHSAGTWEERFFYNSLASLPGRGSVRVISKFFRLHLLVLVAQLLVAHSVPAPQPIADTNVLPVVCTSS